MEPLAALSAAGNVVQFVDFAFKLLVESRAIHKSAKGIGSHNVVLSVIAQDTYDLCDAMSAGGSGPASVTNLLSEAQRMARELLQAVHRLQVRGDCTKWKSFTAALNQVWSQKKIDDFANSLVRIQSQLASRMQMLLL